MGARSRQEGPPETPGLLGRTRRDDAAHNAPLHYRASRQGGAEVLPKHEEGRVGRVGNGKIQEGFRRSPRYSQRPTQPGEGLSVNGRRPGCPRPSTSRPPNCRERRLGEVPGITIMRTPLNGARDDARGARWPQRAGRGRAQAEGSEPRGWAPAPVTYALRHAQEVSAS